MRTLLVVAVLLVGCGADKDFVVKDADGKVLGDLLGVDANQGAFTVLASDGFVYLWGAEGVVRSSAATVGFAYTSSDCTGDTYVPSYKGYPNPIFIHTDPRPVMPWTARILRPTSTTVAATPVLLSTFDGAGCHAYAPDQSMDGVIHCTTEPAPTAKPPLTVVRASP